MTEMNLKNGIPGAFKEASDLSKEYMEGDNMENVKIESTKPATVIFVMRDQVCFCCLLNLFSFFYSPIASCYNKLNCTEQNTCSIKF